MRLRLLLATCFLVPLSGCMGSDAGGPTADADATLATGPATTTPGTHPTVTQRLPTPTPPPWTYTPPEPYEPPTDHVPEPCRDTTLQHGAPYAPADLAAASWVNDRWDDLATATIQAVANATAPLVRAFAGVAHKDLNATFDPLSEPGHPANTTGHWQLWVTATHHDGVYAPRDSYVLTFHEEAPEEVTLVQAATGSVAQAYRQEAATIVAEWNRSSERIPPGHHLSGAQWSPWWGACLWASFYEGEKRLRHTDEVEHRVLLDLERREVLSHGTWSAECGDGCVRRDPRESPTSTPTRTGG